VLVGVAVGVSVWVGVCVGVSVGVGVGLGGLDGVAVTTLFLKTRPLQLAPPINLYILSSSSFSRSVLVLSTLILY
jgi:hypothetical protein